MVQDKPQVFLLKGLQLRDEIIQSQYTKIHQLLIFLQLKNYSLEVDLQQLIVALQ